MHSTTRSDVSRKDLKREEVITSVIQTNKIINEQLWADTNPSATLRQIIQNRIRAESIDYFEGVVDCYLLEANALTFFPNPELHRRDVCRIKALELSQKISYRSGIGRAKNGMALALYNYHTSYDQAVEYASEAAEIASEIGDTGMKWSALKNLSMLFTTLGDIARGFEFFHQALEIADKHFDERRIFKTIYDCSCNEVAPHLYDPYIRRALSLVYVMPRLKHFLYINYAQMLSRMGRIAESKEYVDAFISALPAAPDKDRAKNHNQLGIYYFENGDSINASIEFERAIELGIIPPDARCVHCRMGQIYSKTDPHRALTHLLKSIEISDVYTDWTDANCNHGHLADLYQSLGEIDKAAEHFLIYKKITEESKLKEEGLRAEYAGIIHRFEESQKHERLLAEEVKAKSTALTEKAMLLAEQTELLANFRDEMRALLSKVEANDPAINEIRRKLRSLPEAVNWKEFDEQFQSVHPQFQEVLRENYPALTKMELKNCVLLRLNLNSRDISKLLCLSKRTIESHRHSIRKKLGIKPEEDVAIFLQRI